ncbi:MAG: DNA-primase RepB domain-containing protein [Acidobacteriota bacterium]
MTRRVIRAYAALAVHTSPAGGCHLWLRADRALDQCERTAAQAWLAARTASNPRSVSGEHLGRLAGFKNWKRSGTWVNVLGASATPRTWNPAPALRIPTALQSARTSFRPSPVLGRDTSPSGREWAWVCSMLETGADPSSVLTMFVNSAQPRRGNDTRRYAHRTLNRALLRTALRRHPETLG